MLLSELRSSQRQAAQKDGPQDMRRGWRRPGGSLSAGPSSGVLFAEAAAAAFVLEVEKAGLREVQSPAPGHTAPSGLSEPSAQLTVWKGAEKDPGATATP